MHPEQTNTDYPIPSVAGVFGRLFLMVIASTLLSTLLILGLNYVFGLDFREVMTYIDDSADLRTRNFVRLITVVNQVFTFLVPGILLTLLLFKNHWYRFLKMNIRPQTVYIFGGLLLMFSIFPLIQYTNVLNHAIRFPDWITDMESSTENVIEAILKMDSPLELIINVLIIGLIPAIGEELIFRGIVQQTILSRLKERPHLAIWITAIIFSAIHFQFLGFIPRMLLGAVLGYLFYWSRSLWVPIIAHFANNSIQVVMVYFFADKIPELDPDNLPDVPVSGALISLIIAVGIGYFLSKYKKTPDYYA